MPSGGYGVLPFELSNVGHDLCFVTQVGLDPASDPAFWLPDSPVGVTVLSFPGDTSNPAGLPTSVVLEAELEPTTAEVAAAGTVDVTTFNGVPAQQSIALTGTSQSTCLTVQPASLDFGPRGVNPANPQMCTPETVNFVVMNGCSAAVTVNQIALNTGLDAVPQFTLQDIPQLPSIIAAGGQVNFQATFAPTSAGAKVEAITVASGGLPGNSLLRHASGGRPS